MTVLFQIESSWFCIEILEDYLKNKHERKASVNISMDLHVVNPLTPRSYQYLNSPYSFNTLSSRQVMRITKIIIQGILS